MHKYWPPIGIADACLQNENYKTMLAEVEIASFANIDDMKMINKELQKVENKILMQSDIDLYEIVNNQLFDCSNNNNLQTIKTKVIYLWRSTHYSNQEIAFKLDLKEIIVSKYIAEYKRAVKTQLRINKLQATEKRAVVSPSKTEEIRTFWKQSAGKIITIRDIKKRVWNTNNRCWRPWDSTIASVIKKKLRMSYRVLKKLHSKVALEDQKTLYCQSVFTQFLMKSDLFELVYIDDFSISGRK